MARGRFPTAFTVAAVGATVVLVALSGAPKGVEAVVPESETSKKLAQIRGIFERPRLDGVDNPEDLLPAWLTSWRILLQNQVDGLFSELEQHRSLESAGLDDSPASPHLVTNDGLGFRIAVVGDSTMRMQAKVLSWLLGQRVAEDGRLQCYDASPKDDVDLVDLRCSRNGEGLDAGRGPPPNESVVLSLQYVKVFKSCAPKTRDVDANFVYFGCGLHFLQLVPEKKMENTPLDIWVHYGRWLEEAVRFYRSVPAGVERSRVSIGEAFMTTHSFALDLIEGDYKTRQREYQEGNATLLAMCREAVNEVKLLHLDWEKEYEPKDMCTRGCFDNFGVADLNRRAEAVMARLGVPIVPGYDITQGQSWASGKLDGRHYPGLVPLELNSFLSEVNTALRNERHRHLAGVELIAADMAGEAVDSAENAATATVIADTTDCLGYCSHVATFWGGAFSHGCISVVSVALGFYLSSARWVRKMQSAPLRV